MVEKQFYVYILAKDRNSTFYVGVTSDLVKRVWQHKSEVADGFTKKYGVKTLVYYEVFSDPENAIKREKRLKKWNHDWKMKAIEEKIQIGMICMTRFVVRLTYMTRGRAFRMPAQGGHDVGLSFRRSCQPSAACAWDRKPPAFFLGVVS